MLRMTDILTSEARRAELLRQAERTRLLARPTPPAHGYPIFRPLIAWLGRRLISFGFRLLIVSREWDVRARTVYNGVEW